MTEVAPTLIYDGDCGFCTRSARQVERLPVRVRLAPWQTSDLAALGIPEERARREVVWVERPGPVRGGAAAVAELFKHCRGPWRLVGIAMTLPLIRTLAAWVYRLAAQNRHRLPGSTPACQLPAEQRPGAGGGRPR
ncbi:thiol-disulfide oxidoreductase DCC family protein [Salinactinospora qingdaonensis]|uniref:DUF393 domain-containing protein n=1 Tax=Salinactinospora qingdaonensis TaxID=702744 RepID=A0ABP7F7N4_9ACTN